MSHKRIAWKSWNQQADSYIERIDQETLVLMELMMGQSEDPEAVSGGIPLTPASGQAIHTPLGMYAIDSLFKPSDRWDCWIGTTNFGITRAIENQLKETDGIECLRILGKYTFFVGIPCTFSFRDVRMNIEKQLCVYTEQEIMTENTRLTVDLLKEQIKSSKYWSIFVGKGGCLDYIVGDKLDTEYLEGLRRLDETKQLMGGIILRGDNG
jgi:hypothetical protein